MKKIIFLSLILLLITPTVTQAALIDDVSGKILLQVEEHGEAWYVNPDDNHRYFMGRPDDAFTLMQHFGLGITNTNLREIPIGFMRLSGKDSDGDGLSDDFEKSQNMNINNRDTDGDGYFDDDEIRNGYSPLIANGPKLNFNQTAVNRLKGKILIQVESHGEAWYVNPSDGKRYFLSRPADAFQVMQNLGLGILNANLNLVPENILYLTLDVPNMYSVEYPYYWTVYQTENQPDELLQRTDIEYLAKADLPLIAYHLRIYSTKDIAGELCLYGCPEPVKPSLEDIYKTIEELKTTQSYYSQRQFKVNGYDAVQVTLGSSDDNTPSYFKTYIVLPDEYKIINGTILSSLADAEQAYNNSKDTFQHMIDSFRFK